jgi:DNA excision repair protein ERCC-4
MAHTSLRPEDITAIIDTREQRPWTLAPLKTVTLKLDTADYSILGLSEPGGIIVERKSLPDLLGCTGGDRERWEGCLKRMHAYPDRIVIVEASFQSIVMGGWINNEMPGVQSRMNPKAVVGSLLGWMAQGVPFLFCANAEEASVMAARFLFIAARRRFVHLRAFHDGLKLTS